ncbi:hypothetical protein [Phenylobacterium sp.]|uniref:hypothetical protein n=1 Tax=Phenylobacterium sp. TaxID=1871053 RepID=UPI002F3ECDCF
MPDGTQAPRQATGLGSGAAPARPMTLLQKAVYRGPHLYSRLPMVRLMVDLGDLEAHPTNQLPGGRIGRLLGAVAHNPRILGVGIDEDTAICLSGVRFDVLGSGAVYVVDAEDVTQSNIAEARSESALSLHDVRLHVLAAGDGFDLDKRQPLSPDQARARPAFQKAD